MSNPKISIVTVCYNSEATIQKTIISIISQDYDNLEYIIIDGGSIDGTLQIIDKYRDHISIVVSEPDKGISDAFNKGIKQATGELIGLINSDDLLAEGALSALVASYAPEIDVYRGNVIIEDGELGTRYLSRPTMKFPMTSRISHVCHAATFITKDAYQRWGGYRVDFKYMMDEDLLFRYYQSGAKFEYVNEPLAVFRIGGKTSDMWTMKLGEFKRMLSLNNLPLWIRLYRTTTYVAYHSAKQLIVRFLGIHHLRLLKYGNCNG